MLRIIQSIPSPNAEPLKLWLARVGKKHVNFRENKKVAKEGGSIAGVTRRKLEGKTGKKLSLN